MSRGGKGETGDMETLGVSKEEVQRIKDKMQQEQLDYCKVLLDNTSKRIYDTLSYEPVGHEPKETDDLSTTCFKLQGLIHHFCERYKYVTGK